MIVAAVCWPVLIAFAKRYLLRDFLKRRPEHTAEDYDFLSQDFPVPLLCAIFALFWPATSAMTVLYLIFLATQAVLNFYDSFKK